MNSSSFDAKPGLSNGAFFFANESIPSTNKTSKASNPLCATQRWAANFKALGRPQRLPLLSTGEVANTSILALQTAALRWACLSIEKGFWTGNTVFHSAYLGEKQEQKALQICILESMDTAIKLPSPFRNPSICPLSRHLLMLWLSTTVQPPKIYFLPEKGVSLDPRWGKFQTNCAKCQGDAEIEEASR